MRATESLQQFENLFTKTDSCWIWHGQRHQLGYGIVRHQSGRREAAHRIAFRFYRGEIPRGLLVCHKCDTPSCVNPEHLFLGSQKDNLLDMIKKGRKKIWHPVGEKNPKSIFSEQQIRIMRSLYDSGQKVANIRRRFGGAYQSVWLAVKRKTWKHI